MTGNRSPMDIAGARREFDRVHAPLLLCFDDVVRECGGNPDHLLAQAGLRRDEAAAGALDYGPLARLLELCARALSRPDFGMLLALRQCSHGIEGALGHAMRHAGDFGEMLDLAVRHGYAHSLASHTWLHRPRHGEWVAFGHDIVSEGAGGARQLMEQILLIGHLTSIRLTEGRVRSRRVLLRHAPLSAAGVYRRYFGCEVRFDQRAYATIYRGADLACAISSADNAALGDEIRSIQARFAQKQLPLSRKVRGAIMHALHDGPCTAEGVSAQLQTHVRSLHRHLAQEGTSFRKIRDEVRRDLADYYLRETDIDMKSISERLGFSEQSAFSRRARTWFAASPIALRHSRAKAQAVSDRVKPM